MMISDRKDALKEAYDYIRRQYQTETPVGIILGTGLGGLVKEIEIEKSIPYNFIPHFPISTVETHFGKLIFGKLRGKPIVAMQGRFHYYEGYDMWEITFPVRIMRMLGVKFLLISNAGGGMNMNYGSGDLVVLDDHINLQPENPLRGPYDPEWGPRFVDMSAPYDKELIEKALAFGKANDFQMHKGIYVSVVGPSLETRAEYRYLHGIGADVVGMSTVPEVIIANQGGMRVCAVSVITDLCDPDNLDPINIDHIIATANEAEPRLTALMAHLVEELDV